MKNKNNYLRTNAKKQAYKNKGITLIALFLAFTYSLNVWLGVCASAVLLMGIGRITLNILEENERGY